MDQQELTTRHGRSVPGLGKWEIQQIQNNPKYHIPVDPPEKISVYGRNNGVKFLSRVTGRKSRPPYWNVRIYINKVYWGSKDFSDHCYNNDPELSRSAAIIFINDKLQELAKIGIFPEETL